MLNVVIIIDERHLPFARAADFELASEEKAGNAAESVADYQKDMNQIKEKLALLQWGVGLIVVAEVIPLLKALFS